MRILKLTASNIKRLKAVEITPDGNLVKITGKNKAGKSSVMDSIFWALGGTGNIPSKPIRKGQTEAEVTLDMGDITVNRKITNDGTTLVVETKEGAVFRSPQSLLTDWLGRFTMDPLEFERLPPKAQFDQLLTMVDLGIDLKALAQERAKVFAERTDINRRAKRLKAEVEGMGIEDDAPTGMVLLMDLVKKVQDASQTNQANADIRRGLQNGHVELNAQKSLVKKLMADLAEAQKYLFLIEGNVNQLETEVAALVDLDIDQLQGNVAQAEKSNDLARRALEAQAKARAQGTLVAKSLSLTGVLETIDAQKRQALEDAEFPLEGLSLEDGYVTHEGIPLEQLSSSEKLRVALAITMKANPKIKVIRITDGSLLDAASLAEVAKLAEANDFQIWVEMVDESGSVGIVIEEGEVVRVNPDIKAVSNGEKVIHED